MTDVILRISGMDCGACAVRIVRALRGLPGVHAVSVSDTAGCARLTYDEAAVGLGEIARCVQRAGFAVPVETAELRCPGADDGAEARLRAVFGVRSAARAGDTFMVTLWPVGTDAAALPAVLGPGAELTAQRGGEEAQQGRTRQRLARRLGFGVLLTALMLWRLPELVQLALAAAVLFGAGAALWRGTWRVLRGGSLGPDAPGLLAALILFAYSAYAAFTGLRPCFPAPCGRAGRAAHARRGGVGRADGAHRAPGHLAAAGVSCRVSAAGCVRGDRPGRGGGACVRYIRRRAAVCAARERNEGGAAMTTTVLELNVSGMICRACEDAIADALLHTRGVVSAQAHYWRGRVTITYDPNIVTEDTLRQVLTNAGYPPGTHGMGGVVVDGICLALVGVLYWGLPKLLALVKVPALADNASLGLVFLVGLLTSTHCIGMCGGILLAQTTDARGVTGRSKRGLIASAAYNGGRVVSYTAVGALCGALGAVITYTPNIKSMVFTVAGALVLLIGLRMAGILPGLRSTETELPGACSLNARTRRRFAGRPLIIGLLTGFMPCGALSAMWLCAMSSGSAARGALVMLVFSLGTVPLLFLFGALQSFLPRGWMKYIVKGSAVLVVTLGLSMLVKGIRLFGM